MCPAGKAVMDQGRQVAFAVWINKRKTTAQVGKCRTDVTLPGLDAGTTTHLSHNELFFFSFYHSSIHTA